MRAQKPKTGPGKDGADSARSALPFVQISLTLDSPVQNSARIRQSRPDSDIDFHAPALRLLRVVPSLLGSGLDFHLKVLEILRVGSGPGKDGANAGEEPGVLREVGASRR